MLKIINKIIRRLMRLIFILFFVYAGAYISSFGWNFFMPDLNTKPSDAKLSGRLKAHVRKLSEEIGDRNVFNYAKLEKAAEYIVKELASYGCQVRFQSYMVEGKKTKNIIFTKLGLNKPEEFIVLGAHYDSCLNPGADDDASGVAGLLELARLLKDKDVDKTIEFVFFVNEEPPFFKTETMGSSVFVRQARYSGKDIKAAIVFDMIGYYADKPNSQRYFPLITGLFLPNKGNFIAVFGNSKSRQLAEDIKKYFRRGSTFPIETLVTDFDPTIDFSDNWSFWSAGYQAVMVSDTVFLRSKDYHTSSDTWERLNFESMACVVEGFYHSIIALANS